MNLYESEGVKRKVKQYDLHFTLLYLNFIKPNFKQLSVDQRNIRIDYRNASIVHLERKISEYSILQYNSPIRNY